MRQNTCIFATQTPTNSPKLQFDSNLYTAFRNMPACICVHCCDGTAILLSWTQSSESHTKFASIVSLLYVFFDYWFFENDFNFVVVFLYPILAMVMFKHLYNSNSTTRLYPNTYIISTLLIDIVWSVLSNLYTVNMSMHFSEISSLHRLLPLLVLSPHLLDVLFRVHNGVFLACLPLLRLQLLRLPIALPHRPKHQARLQKWGFQQRR